MDSDAIMNTNNINTDNINTDNINTDNINPNNINHDNILKESGENDHEQPQQHSTMEPTKETQTQKELIDEAITVSEKLKAAIDPSARNDKSPVEKKREIKNIENPFKNLNYKVTQLVYWENPPQSGASLVSGLALLIFTAYYSLFNTFCALAVILMGANWVYVMGRKQFESLFNQKPVNPHEHLLVNKPWYIERKDAEKHLDSIINTVNFVLLEAQKIVLVDDPMRTIRHVVMFYILWTLGTWVSLRTLFGIALVLSFSTPIAYQKNKTLVDEKLHQSNKLFQTYYERGLVAAKQHTGGAYEKAKSFAVTKGLVNGDNTAKKEE